MNKDRSTAGFRRCRDGFCIAVGKGIFSNPLLLPLKVLEYNISYG